jgi:hypothetical protein
MTKPPVRKLPEPLRGCFAFGRRVARAPLLCGPQMALPLLAGLFIVPGRCDAPRPWSFLADRKQPLQYKA